MAPSQKTEAEKKAHKAKKARERRERKKTAAKAQEAAKTTHAPTPAASGRATETPQPLEDITSAPPGQNDRKLAYDVTNTGAKVVNTSRMRSAPPEEESEELQEPREKLQEEPQEESYGYQKDDDDMDHLTELVGQVMTLKHERLEQDKVCDNAEKKYKLAKHLYQTGKLRKKAFDVEAKEWETSLQTGIVAHEWRKVRLVNLESDIDKEFRRIATRMLVTSTCAAPAGSILEDFQDLSIYDRHGFLKIYNNHQQVGAKIQQEERRESRIEALADFWTLGLRRDSKGFDDLVKSLRRRPRTKLNEG